MRVFKIKGIKYNEARKANAQKKVITGYKKNMTLNKEQIEMLHMFFSPYRVPKDMTKGEIRLAILLQANLIGKAPFPEQRDGYSSSMTRSGFLKIIRQIIKQMD